MKIEQIQLKSFVTETLLQTKKYKNYTEIQEKIIPLALENKSVIGISKTGSGKSDAFLIPVFNKINFKNNTLQTLIITPTRELATQIYNKTLDYKKHQQEIIVQLLVGGYDRDKVLKQTTIPHIIIATPARAKDILIDNALFDVSSINTLVIDEIDMIFEMKFLDDLSAIMSKLKDDIQTLGFSATIDEHVHTFLKKYLATHELIQIDKNKSSDTITHYGSELHGMTREEALLGLIKNLNPYLCLIFASKKTDVDKYYKSLVKNGYKAIVLHGDLDARVRRRNLKRIENDEFQFIVASDIAARGIDIPNITHVISTDIPYNIEYYFHRAGRTGRNNEPGEVYFFYDKKEQASLNKLINNNLKINYFVIRNNKVVLTDRKTRKKKDIDHSLNKKIVKIKNIHKKKKVKPNYKKKMKQEIARVKKQHRRQQLKKQILSQRKGE